MIILGEIIFIALDAVVSALFALVVTLISLLILCGIYLLYKVMDYLFDVVGVNRIESRHDPRNPNSGKVMMKCGMKYEGTLRSSDHNNQGICDACFYALLKSER